MQNNSNSIILCFLLLITFSCVNKKSSFPELDLLEYGIPILIKAPPEAEVLMNDLGIWKDITVKKGDNFSIQIISSQAISINAATIKSQKLEEVKNEIYFSKIIQEDEYGFIYEKQIDDVTDYDFRYVKIQADREYIFQTGLIGTFTEAQVRQMYAAVQ